MPRDILSGFGKDIPHPQSPRATDGGKLEVKDLPYDNPVGPSNINDGRTPGLHGSNHGNCGTQGKH